MEEGQQTLEEKQDQEPGRQLAPPQSPPLPRKRHRALVWIIVLALAIGSYFLVQHYEGALRRPQASRLIAPNAVAVTTAIAKKGNIGVYLEAIGTVTPVTRRPSPLR